MRNYTNLLIAGGTLGLLAAVGCGTARDYPGQPVPGQLLWKYEVDSHIRAFEEPRAVMEAPIPTPSSQAPGAQSNPNVTSQIPGALTVAVYAGGRGVDRVSQEGSPQIPRLIPTYAWINAYSLSSTVADEPVQPGSTVLAYDPDGVLIGRSVVDQAGRYGVMALYMDDPVTPIDEGALPGDQIRFEIDGREAVTVGPDQPIWSANGAALHVDLKVGGPAN